MPFKPTPRALPSPKTAASKNIWKERVEALIAELEEINRQTVATQTETERIGAGIDAKIALLNQMAEKK